MFGIEGMARPIGDVGISEIAYWVIAGMIGSIFFCYGMRFASIYIDRKLAKRRLRKSVNDDNRKKVVNRIIRNFVDKKKGG